ncbi:hypothetical protein NA57DRAFT_73994 [Rhizodiscina lignyota]|uniref:Zn(2)-C6 fungal-type domain-containing protein n=1 Tax=Rhizodiscina lignyota TaxID=1504668 RepID=A0A9P4II28_9PEZI|nr:hypothetical protein NA57DRAFT_73994 [Rhizodiscina lignyota]
MDSNTRKRKHSSTDNTEGRTEKRTTKHRSSQACQACRVRKVRCDVLKNDGSSCTNCRLDDVECVVLASKRGKKYQRATLDDIIVQSRPPTSDDNSNNKNDPASTEAILTPIVSAVAGDVPVCVTFDEDHQENNNTQQQAASHQEYTKDSSMIAQGEKQQQANVVPPPLASPSPHHQSPAAGSATPLPAFIAPLPAHMPSEDLDFLRRKGAFAMPEPALRAEILRCYIFSVHPFTPILDLPVFVQAAVNGQEDSRISLLLFQAVMFAGIASLDRHFVQLLGFDRTKPAREVFFDRVRLLYEFDVEQDQTAVLQSLLLMSWWYGRWNKRRHTWHWTGLALSVALNMGLHREPMARCGSDKTRHFRRRLWWSLYIRDRLLALGTRRPMRIRDDSFDVTMLALEDFDIQTLGEFGSGQPPTPDVEESTRTALMCIELAKLSICIGHVLTSHYTTLSAQPDVPHTMMVVPKGEKDRTVGELGKCEREIDEWFQVLAHNVRRTQNGPSRSSGCSEVHWGILNMVYLTLVNVLHRVQALEPLSDGAEAQAVQKASRAKVKEAARNVTELAHTMLRHDQARYLGLPGVTALVAACLSHTLDIRSSDEDVRDASVFRFSRSMQVLQSLSEIYASADSAVLFLAWVIRKAGISMPVQMAFSPALDSMSRTDQRLVQPITTASEKEHTGGWKAAALPHQGRRCTISAAHGPIAADRGDWPESLLDDPDREVAPGRSSSMMHHSIPPATGSLAFTYSPSSFLDKSTPARKDDMPFLHFGFIPSRELPSISGMGSAPFFEWNNSLDSAGLDFEPIAFNYDFGLNTFGFLGS